MQRAAEEIPGESEKKRAAMNLFDHGYLTCVEHWGSDERIIEAARMSTGKGFLGWGTAQNPGDERLLRYLWKNKHSTPFETPGLTVEVKCPIVVVWQWVRHRTMTYNILSGRYAEMPEEDYVPTLDRLLLASHGNKQASAIAGAEKLTESAARGWIEEIKRIQKDIQAFYKKGLALGVPKEIARFPLGFTRYTRMRVSANLFNWLRFLDLRMASDAQYEIRVYAQAAGEVVAKLFPRTWELFLEGRRNHTIEEERL